MTALHHWLTDLAARAIRDRPPDNVWQHAAQHIYLEGHASLTHRYYDPDLTPYTKLFQEIATGQYTNIHPDDWWLQNIVNTGQRVEEFFAIKSSQSGFTQAALNIIIYLTRYLTGRGLYCIDSKEKAGRLCKLRLIPILEKLCAEQISSDADDLGTYWLELANWVWEMVGSYSAGVFSEKPLTHVFLDDVEYMVTEGGKRGMLDGVHIIDHARSRFTTADDHLLAVFSKPELDDSIFVQNAKGGSQHTWHTPCPNCNHHFALELHHLNWRHPGCKDLAGTYDLAAVENLTTAKCPKCEHDIEERWKPQMNAAGFYLPKSREARVNDKDPLLVPRRFSCRVNDMVSPFKEVSWGRLACQLIQAENHPEKLRHVLTNHGAIPWKEKAINLKAENIRALIAGNKNPQSGNIHGESRGVPRYARGECPFKPVLVTATADRQGDKKKWTLFGWKIDGTCALIEYGACLGDQTLLDLCDRPLSHHGQPIICLADESVHIHAGLGLDTGGCLIDSGFETFDVYDFCHASGWRWYPSKGVTRLTDGGYLVEAKRDFKDGREILRYHYNDYQLKVHFYKGIIERHSHPDPKIRKPSPLHLPHDIDDEFIAELLSESLQPRKLTTGGVRMEWHHDKSIAPNDYADALKMQFALWQILSGQLQSLHTVTPPASSLSAP